MHFVARSWGPVGWVLLRCVLFCVVAAGCEDRRIDTGNLEAILAERYASQAGLPVTEVRCPERVPTRKDHHFDCTVVFASGAELVIDVHELGGTNLRWSPRGPIPGAPRDARAE